MSSTGRETGSLERSVALRPAGATVPFDLRAAKSRRISSESAPGLTLIRLLSQLFDQATHFVSEMRGPWAHPEGWLSSLTHESLEGHRANGRMNELELE